MSLPRVARMTAGLLRDASTYGLPSGACRGNQEGTCLQHHKSLPTDEERLRVKRR